jgi:trehalose 6-phosphate synthase
MLAAFIMLGAAIFAISPFASTFVEQWSRRDVELRSKLVFNSVRDELANLLAVGATAQIDDLFGRLALDERLLAVGFCDREGLLRYHSKLMPSNFSCEKVARAASASFSAIGSDDRRLLVGSFPIATDKTSGHLVLLHDLTFAEQRSAQARTWIAIALTGVALIGAALASIFALLIVRRWLQSIRRAVDDVCHCNASLWLMSGCPRKAKELYVLAQSHAGHKERARRRRKLKWLWARLQRISAMKLPREELLTKSAVRAPKRERQGA